MKKKLLIIIHSLRRGGGAERVVSNLTVYLSKKYNIHLLTIFDFRDLYPYKGKYYSLKENLGLIRKILNSLKLYTLIRPLRIYKLIRKISPDVIISNMDLTNISIILSKIIFRFKIPLIISTHTNPKIAYQKKKAYINILLKIFYYSKFINKIITVSKEIQNIFKNEYKIDRNKLETVYNSIDIERINELKKERISNSKKLFYNKKIIKFITIGSLRKVKGHKHLIDAFSEVKKQVPNSKLIIIGEGPLRRELEEKIKELNLINDVILLGLKRNPYNYLANSDIFVFSSLYEGFGIVLLEALACGLPIISTNCETGPREILGGGKYGLLVNIMDIEDLRDKMILLAQDKDLISYYTKDSLKRANTFDIKKIVNKWIEIIDSF
ncbi:MAG: glycosyltransferase [Candidatus Lokiarchaeia archaeon]